MLYVNGGAGVIWNGLVKVTETPSGGAVREFFLDGDKILNLSGLEEYAATIEAVSYPKEFAPCNGLVEFYPGSYAANQPRQPFGFSYRTLIGNDLEGIADDYKLHIVYNVTAKGADVVHQTITRTPNMKTYSWTFNTVPVSYASYKPGSHFVLDTRNEDSWFVTAIENILYGTATTNPRLPTVAEIMSHMASEPMKKMALSGAVLITPAPVSSGAIKMKKMKITGALKGKAKVTANPRMKKMVPSISGTVTAAAYRSNTLEGGTNATSITTANSGGASGNAFDYAFIGSGVTLAYENAQKMHGSLSMAVQTVAAAASYAGWNITNRKFWGRFYIYRPALETANTRIAAAYGTAPATASRAFIRIANGGKLVACDSASAILWTSANVLPASQWIRIEFMMDCDASAGQFNLSYYNTPDGTTPTESFSSTATQNLGGVPADFLFGVPIGQANVGKIWYDDMALSLTGPLGHS